MVANSHIRRLFSSLAVIMSAFIFSACSEAFWDSMADSDYGQTMFYGRIKEIRTVYYVGNSGSGANGALVGAVIGGIAGAGLSNGSGMGALIGAGAGAAIGGAAAQNSLRENDFSDSGSVTKRATKMVIKKDNGDRVVVVQRFTRALMPGDRVRVSIYSDGSVTVRRVMDDRNDYYDDYGDYRHHRHRHYHDD